MWSHDASSRMDYDAQAYSYDAGDEEMRECKEEEDTEEGFHSSSTGGYAVEYPQQQVLGEDQGRPWNDAVRPHVPPSAA